MGSDRWLVHASPLIMLGKTHHLDLLARHADILGVPQTVASEAGAKPRWGGDPRGVDCKPGLPSNTL